MKKKTIAIILANAFTLCSLAGCSKSKYISQGNGENYVFTEIGDFTNLANYKYRKETKNYWDFYSVSYKITTFEYEYYESILPSSFYGNARLENELISVSAVSTEGMMAHNEGIYYLKEDETEVLLDTVYNAYAVRIGNFFERLFSDNTVGNGWICWTSKSSSEYDEDIESLLLTLKHFYDKELLLCYNLYPDFFTRNNNIYTLNVSNEVEANKNSETEKNKNTEILQKIAGFFDLSDDISGVMKGFSCNVTQANGMIDLTKANQPTVSFNYQAYFPYINQSIECGGTLQYNYVNNTVIKIEEEVVKEWEKDADYMRYKTAGEYF